MIKNYHSKINKINAYELSLSAKNTGLIRDLNLDKTPEGIVDLKIFKNC